MGFQHMREVVHQAASRKGGRIKTKKGLAAMPPEQSKAIHSKGGKARYENQRRRGAKQAEASESGNTSIMEAILGDIDGDSNTWANSESEEQQADNPNETTTTGR